MAIHVNHLFFIFSFKDLARSRNDRLEKYVNRECFYYGVILKEIFWEFANSENFGRNFFRKET